MGGHMPIHPFQYRRCVKELFVNTAALVVSGQLWFNFQSHPNGYLSAVRSFPFRNQFADGIRFAERNIQNTSHIFEHGLGFQGSEGTNACNVIVSVFFMDIFGYFAPAFKAEIHVKIRHAHAFRI